MYLFFFRFFSLQFIKNTECISLCYIVSPVGYLFYYRYVCISHSVVSDSLDSMDCSLPGFSIHGILQIEYRSGQHLSPPGALPNPGIEPRSPTLQADSLLSELQGKFYMQQCAYVHPELLIYPPSPETLYKGHLCG